MKLALTVPLGGAETATGFASRLAMRNHSQFVQDFVQDMGITWQSVISGDAEALSVLAELGGIKMSDLERGSFRRAAGRARRLGAEIVPIRMLRVTNQRVCPLCLAQDGPVPPAGSVLWQFEPVLACPEHAVALVELPASKFPRSPYDLAGRILDHRTMIDAAAMHPQPMTVTAFERYFAARALGAEHPPTWLDQFNVSIVWRASESLGLRIRNGAAARADSLSDQELSAALDAGFKVLAAGPHALHAAMSTSRENQSTDVGGFYTEFVMFARFLKKLEKTNETKPLLDAVRDFIERTYPIGDGEDVMGRPCAQRHVHSVQTASREFGVDWIRMQRLIQAIADTPGHLGLPAPTAHLWVQADAWSPWLRRYARALNPKKAAKQLGLNTGPFTRLVKSGILQPVASLPGLVDRFDPVEIDALLEKLFKHAKPVEQLAPDMAMALTAHARCGQDLSGLLRLVLARELPFVGRLIGAKGVASLIIRPQDVLNACPKPRLGGYHSSDLMRILAINASGVALITTNKLINYEEQRDPHTGRKVRTFTPEDLEAFQRKYISLSHVATRLNTLPKHAAARLRARGILPLPARGLCSKIYRREDVDFI